MAAQDSVSVKTRDGSHEIVLSLLPRPVPPVGGRVQIKVDGAVFPYSRNHVETLAKEAMASSSGWVDWFLDRVPVIGAFRLERRVKEWFAAVAKVTEIATDPEEVEIKAGTGHVELIFRTTSSGYASFVTIHRFHIDLVRRDWGYSWENGEVYVHYGE